MPPLAVSVIALPLQTVGLEGAIMMVGFGATSLLIV
jgi:hypothetical protein